MTKITPEDIADHKRNGRWRVLQALSNITNQQAEKAANSKLNPVLGGGARLMLALDHRLSNDVDLFITDPQWLGYLTPRLNDAIEERVTSYIEGTTSLKLVTADGEIDYIVSTSLLGLPNESSPESIYALEPIAEILAKKLYYRGGEITPRDLFDWRMIDMLVPAEELHHPEMASLLSEKLPDIALALDALSQLPNDHPRWAAILTPYPLDLQETVAWAKERVDYYRQLAPSVAAPEDADAQHQQPAPNSDSPSP